MRTVGDVDQLTDDELRRVEAWLALFWDATAQCDDTILTDEALAIGGDGLREWTRDHLGLDLTPGFAAVTMGAGYLIAYP